MRLAAYLEGKEARINLTVTLLGVEIRIAGTVQFLDVRVPNE